MTQKSSKIPNCDAVYKNENNTWFSSVLLCMYWQIIHGLYHIFTKYGTIRVLFASTYTAKQMKTMYYSLLKYNAWWDGWAGIPDLSANLFIVKFLLCKELCYRLIGHSNMTPHGHYLYRVDKKNDTPKINH